MSPEWVVRFQNLDEVKVDTGRLSTSERERVQRKGSAQLRQRQAASFHWVRECLGAALGRSPGAIAILVDGQGKPYLDGRELHFNVSHSGPMGMIAWGPREVGADLERLIRPPVERLAARILSDREREHWQALHPASQPAWITRAWTRKEAALKAIGSGLRRPPRQIDVGGGEGEGGAWGLACEGRRWSGQDWVSGVPEGFLAAICVHDDHG